jgi:hypothetical protein
MDSPVKWIKQVAAASLVTVGGLCLLAVGIALADGDPNRTNRAEVVTAGLILGLPLTGAGGWLWQQQRRQQQQLECDRIRQVFFQLVQTNRGLVTPLGLAIAAQINGDQARQQLDQWARQFDASFQVDDAGTVLYEFSELR